MRLDLAPLIKRRLFDDALRLFRNMIEYAHACHGSVHIGSRSTATYTLTDYPQYDWPEPVEWNGALVVPAGHGGGPAVNCLPRFEPWINVLGREYVELLGRDKLLGLDVYSKREDDAGRIWLQITERPEQMHLPETKEQVQRLMDSLEAPDVFCREPRTKEEREHGIMDYRRPKFDWSDTPPPATPIPPEERMTHKYFLDIRKNPIPWAASSERVPTGSIPAALLGEVITAALKHRAELEVYGVTMSADERYLRFLRELERYRTQQARLAAMIQLLRVDAEDKKMWGVGWCVVETSSSTPSDSPASGVLRMHVESSTVPYPHEPVAFDVSLLFTKQGRKLELGEMHAERGELSVFR